LPKPPRRNSSSWHALSSAVIHPLAKPSSPSARSSCGLAPRSTSNTWRKKNGYAGPSVTCPHCDYAAAYHTQAARTLVSLFGPIRYQRAYYYCRGCGQGFYPFDRQAGLPRHQLTPAVERLASLAGGVSPSFEKGSELLKEMSGV